MKSRIKRLISAILIFALMVSAPLVTNAEEFVFADSFEVAFDDLPIGWKFFGSNAPGCSELEEENVSDGSYGVRITCETDAYAVGIESPRFPVQPGNTYTAIADAFIFSGNCSVFLKFQDSDGKEVGSVSSRSDSVGSWSPVVVNETAPSEAATSSVILYILKSTIGSVSFDNIRVGIGITENSEVPEGISASPSSPSTPGGSGINPAEFEGAYASEIGFLSAANVLDSSFNAEKNLTKGELAFMIVRVMYPDINFSNTSSGDSGFKDVDKNHKYYGYIQACKDLKIISGDNLGYFYPDNEITAIDAITIIINALGYPQYANANGGYPSGYYKVAKDIGVLKGISVSLQEIVSGRMAAKLIYNSLFSSLLVIDSVTGTEVNMRKDASTNLMAERLGIYQYDAIITDNGITSTSGNSMMDTQRVVLEDVSAQRLVNAYKGNSDIGEYLGTRVLVYIKNNRENARNEVVHFSIHPSVRQKEIPASSILRVGSNYIEYETDKDLGKPERLRLTYPVVIFNGVKVKINHESFLFPKDGFLRCVDNYGSGYDFVDVLSFNCYGTDTLSETPRNIVVDSANEEGAYLNCKFNPAASLDLDPDVANYRFIRSGHINNLSALPVNSIVSVAQSPETIDGKKFYYLAVSTKTVEGILEGTSSSSSEVIVGGNSYTVSKSLLSVKNKYIDMLGISNNILLRLDITGKVAHSSGNTSGNKTYAYMIASTIGNGLDEGVVLKLFLQDGSIKKLSLSDKAVIDGTPATPGPGETLYEAQLLKLRKRHDEPIMVGSSSVVPDYLDSTNATHARPVVITANSQGLITSIDTDTPNHAVNSSFDLYSNYNIYYDQGYIKYSDDEIEDNTTLKAGFRSPRLLRYWTGAKTYEGKFYINSDTVVMNVPDIDTYGLNVYGPNYTLSSAPALNADLIKLYENSIEDKNYQIVTSLSQAFVYDAQAYDVDPDTGVASLVVLRGTMKSYYYGSVSSSTPMSIFLRKSEAYDPELRKTIYRIYYTQDGKTEQSVLTDADELVWSYRYLIEGCQPSDTPYNKTVIPLSKGDIIRVTSQENRLTHIERVYRLAGLESEARCSALYPTNSSNPYATTLYQGVGGTGENASIPFDVRKQWYNLHQTYSLFCFYAKKITGNNIVGFLGYSTLSAIDLTKLNTFSEQYLSVPSGGVPVIEIRRDTDNPSNKIVTIKQGSYGDIISADSQNGIDGASIIICKHSRYSISEIFIVNDFSE